MKQNDKNKRNYIIIGLCSILLIMTVGYAAFSQVLEINGTSNITSNWSVEITGIRAVNDSSVTGNSAYDIDEPTVGSDKLSATFHTGLKSPGDARIYEIEVTNKGSLDAEVTSVFTKALSDSVHFSYDGVGPLGGTGIDVLTNAGVYNTNLLSEEEPFSLPATTNNVRYIYMTVKYRESVTSQPSNLSATINLKLNATQSNGTVTPDGSGVHTLSTNGKDIPIVTEGNGLYDNEDGKYIYKESNPDNYLEFEGSIWRILRFDTTGIKIITDSSIDLADYEGVDPTNNLRGAFDIANARSTENNSYCTTPSNGCNVWVRTSKINGSPSEYANGTHHGTVMEDSSLYTYLNGDYYNNTLNANSNIIDGTFNIGPYNNESSYKWTGKIGLSYRQETIETYIKKNISYPIWHITPDSSITSNNNINGVRTSFWSNNKYNGYTVRANLSAEVRPVLYLSPSVTLTGTGTNDENIYKIV